MRSFGLATGSNNTNKFRIRVPVPPSIHRNDRMVYGEEEEEEDDYGSWDPAPEHSASSHAPVPHGRVEYHHHQFRLVLSSHSYQGSCSSSQDTSYSRQIKFGSLKTNGKSIAVHTLIFFTLYAILILAVRVHIYIG
ncbi:hypothetical protein LINGRAHAP2_LOCUS24281 [Linum grandiflorum]